MARRRGDAEDSMMPVSHVMRFFMALMSRRRIFVAVWSNERASSQAVQQSAQAALILPTAYPLWPLVPTRKELGHQLTLLAEQDRGTHQRGPC